VTIPSRQIPSCIPRLGARPGGFACGRGHRAGSLRQVSEAQAIRGSVRRRLIASPSRGRTHRGPNSLPPPTQHRPGVLLHWRSAPPAPTPSRIPRPRHAPCTRNRRLIAAAGLALGSMGAVRTFEPRGLPRTARPQRLPIPLTSVSSSCSQSSSGAGTCRTSSSGGDSSPGSCLSRCRGQRRSTVVPAPSALRTSMEP
jgi:hypothetical protein